MNVTERFLKYVSFDTKSDDNSETVPSTPGQKVLGAYIAEELKALGLADAHMDDCGYVYAYLPATEDMVNAPALGLIAHMDTSPDVSGKDIKPAIIKYAGGDIRLACGEIIPESSYPFLKNYVGNELIVTDGTTLLGADDKSGVAEIVAACEYFIENPTVSHRKIAVCFTPDEEIGRGVDHFDFSAFPAEVAYTVDGGELGEIEYENFNAAACVIKIHGLNIHPGSAKDKMKNAVLYAAEFISSLPAAETPAHTEGYEGFYHVGDIFGNESETEIKMIIRDHDMQKFLARKKFVQNLTDYMNSVYGEGTFECILKDSYFNMKEKILPHMELVTNAENAMRKVGVTPKIVAIRGGTDGAMLSYKGLPCPNLSTGGGNFHGKHEFVSIDAMKKMVEVLIELCR